MSRLIEECFEFENMEEEEYSRWIKVLIPKDTIIVVVDPYLISIRDLVNAKPGQVTLVRIRRPGWGRGNVQEHIHVLEIK